MVDSASKSTGLASVFKDKLGSVISWLGKNPMVVLAGAIGVVTAGIVGLITSQKKQLMRWKIIPSTFRKILKIYKTCVKL